MNRPFYKGWLVAALVVLAPSIASAIGLGKLTVLSLLGQPLNAEIDLVSSPKEPLSTVSARLASIDAYQRSDLQYNAVLTNLNFQIATRPNGQPYIKLTSERMVNDPFLDLLIELKWASGRLVRQYSALIDPSDYAPALAQVPAVATVAVALPPPPPPVAVAMPAPVAVPAVQPQPTIPTTLPANAEYGPIKRGETLSKIAFKLKPQGVSLEQMMVGIFRANPDAFISSDMNRIKANETLNIPDQGQLIALSKSDAIKEVQLQLTKRRQSESASANTTRSRQKASAKDKPVAGKPVLRLSSGDWPMKRPSRIAP